jgi:hypothetical protein
MARARNIKPGFFINEDLCELSPLARLLFVGLWCIADREGRLEDRPKRIKIAVLPADDCDVEALLAQLAARNFVIRYAGETCNLIQISKWDKHQRPHHTERGSTLPGPTPETKALRQKELQALTVNTPCCHGGNPPDSLIHRFTDSLIQKQSQNHKPLSRSQSLEGFEAPELREEVRDVGQVFMHWQASMHKPRALLDDKRRKLIRKALALGYTVSDLCKAIDGCKASAWHMGENERGKAFNTLELILRDAEKIDSFMGIADTPPETLRTQTQTERRASVIAQLTGRAHQPQGGSNDPFTVDV